MNREFGDEELARRIAATMDKQVASQEADLKARLITARHQALASRSSSYSLFDWAKLGRWGYGGAVFASVMIVALLVVMNIPGGEQTGSLDESLELAILDEDAELYADMEFYFWLNQQGESREL